MDNMKRSGLALVLMIVVAGVDAAGQEFPFNGVIQGDKVNVRAGAGQRYYAVSQLNAGTIVSVKEDLYGWYKIEPPADSFSYISKSYVTVDGVGDTGVVVGQRVRIRAPAPSGPDSSYKTQQFLDDGAPVQILGESGAFWKISPPKGAVYYIKGEFVGRATEAQVRASKPLEVAEAPEVAAPVEAAKVVETPKVVEAPKVAETNNIALATLSQKAPVVSAAEIEVAVVTPEPVAVVATQETPEAPATLEAPEILATLVAVETPGVAAGGAAEEKTEAALEAKAEAVVIDVLSNGAIQVKGQVVESEFVGSRLGQLSKEGVREVNVRGHAAVKDDLIASVKSAAKKAGLDVIGAPGAEVGVAVLEGAGEKKEVGVDESPFAPLEVSELKVGATEGAGVRAKRLSLEELELQYRDEQAKPMLERELEVLRVNYEMLASSSDLNDLEKSLVTARLTLLGTDLQKQEALQKIDALDRQMKIADETRKTADAQKPKSYIAVGRLSVSPLYSGRDLPMLYRLVNPLSGLTIAYVKPEGVSDPDPTTLPQDPSRLVGQFVGVVGKKQYDPALKLNIVLASEIDRLGPTGADELQF